MGRCVSRFFCRSGEHCPDPKINKKRSPDQANPRQLRKKKCRKCRKPKSCHAAIQPIGGCRAHTRHKPIQKPVVQCALNAQHANRPNHRRDRKANHQTTKKQANVHLFLLQVTTERPQHKKSRQTFSAKIWRPGDRWSLFLSGSHASEHAKRTKSPTSLVCLLLNQ